MGLMTNELNSMIRDDKKNFGYNVDQLMFKTDIPVFDHLNGQIEYTDNGIELLNIGIDYGKSIMLIGKTGSGKSSLAIQLMYSVMKKYDESTLFLFDFESSSNEARIKALTGMTDEYFKDHVTISKVGIYTDSVLKLVYQIHKFKQEHKQELLVDNKEGVLDDEGHVRKILPPTFVCIDSIQAMSAKGTDDDELDSLTQGARSSIMNKSMLKKCLQPCMESNIILVMINHISTNMSMGVTPPVASTRYLKNTEAVSGGNALQYFANLWLKVEAGDKIIPEKSPYGPSVKGFEMIVTVVKSRNTEGGNSATFVFDQASGIDVDLSSFLFLKSNGIIKGAGVGMYLPGLETVKFRMSTLKDILSTNTAFRNRFDELVSEELKKTIKVSKNLTKTAAAEQEILLEEAAAEVSGETTDVE